MAISSLSPTTPTTGSTTPTKEQTSSKTLTQTFDNFLTLLTTQLKNQDPLSPMDSAEFTQQLVSFAGVEQQINANTKLEELLKINRSAEVLNAAGYLDKYIEADGDQIGLEAAGNSATFAYSFKSDLNSATASIKDSAGTIVRTLNLNSKMGRHEVTWDGKTTAGTAAPKGVYTVSVSALDADNKAVAGTTTVFGKVSDVHTTEDAGTVLTVAGADIPIDKVKSVRATAPAAAAAAALRAL